jgi:hypothetical protein
MANCRNCGVKVGCGCQLINGLCSACNAAAVQGTKRLKNAISKINKLCRVF